MLGAISQTGEYCALQAGIDLKPGQVKRIGPTLGKLRNVVVRPGVIIPPVLNALVTQLGVTRDSPLCAEMIVLKSGS